MRPWWVVIACACGSPSRTAGDAPRGGSDSPRGDTPVVNVGQSAVYAHTATSLYRIDPDTYAATKVGDFGLTGLLEVMTDLAIDKDGNLSGVTFDAVYKVDATTGAATLLSTGGSIFSQFNGLSFVPSTSGPDILVATNRTDGNVYQVNPMTGAASVVGSFGGSFVSSGDIVSVDGFGTVQTVPGSTHDVLVRLAPGTYSATAIGTNTGFDKIYGIGFWKGKVFGFTYGGQIITIDPMTGAGTQVASGGPQWNGAAVTTTAPIIP